LRNGLPLSLAHAERLVADPATCLSGSLIAGARAAIPAPRPAAVLEPGFGSTRRMGVVAMGHRFADATHLGGHKSRIPHDRSHIFARCAENQQLDASILPLRL
jgi:hypothetical protein